VALLETLLKRRIAGLEPLDVVLIADDGALALLTPLPLGAQLVGIVAELPLDPVALPEGVGGIFGVGAVHGLVEDGTLVLLEPERGRALFDPSAKEISRLQQSRKPRHRLDGDSVPARTLGGREVLVWGEALTLDEAEDAMAAGADGLLFAGLFDIDDVKRLAQLVGGGDLTIRSSPDTLEPADWLRLGAQATLRVCLPEEHTPELVRADWDEALTPLLESGERAALPRLSCLLSTPPEEQADWDELILETPWTPDDLLSYPPLYLRLETGFSLLEEGIAAGIAGICVPFSEIQEAKNAIREVP
jgi:hypothetical protein